MFERLQDLLRRIGRRLRRSWFSLTAVALTVVTAATLVAFAPEPDLRPVEDLAVPVTTLVAKPRVLSPELHLYGRVETPHRASLTAMTSATVESLSVREGDRVARGDVLAQLDETDARLLIRRRKSDLVEVRADLEALQLAGADDREVLKHEEELHRLAFEKLDRYRRLREQGSIAEEIWRAVVEARHTQAIALSRQRRLVLGFEHRRARVEARIDRALASLEEATVGLERTRIRAPFPGRVTHIAVAPGELVVPGMMVADIYDDRALQIRAQIPNAYLSVLQEALQTGRQPPVVINFDHRWVSGALERLVGAVGEGQSGVDGLVRLDLDGPPPDLGRTVSLRITLPPEENVLAVPVQAVYGQRRVFLVEDGLLAGVEVDRVGRLTGDDGEQRLLVRAAAFGAEARILTSRLSNAVTGLRVRVEDS